jgi:predicted amidohydrolase YtcJ
MTSSVPAPGTDAGTEVISLVNVLACCPLMEVVPVRDDDKRGSLEGGKLADLAVFDGDLMLVPINKIGSVRSALTIMDGRIVHAGLPTHPSRRSGCARGSALSYPIS